MHYNNSKLRLKIWLAIRKSQTTYADCQGNYFITGTV